MSASASPSASGSEEIVQGSEVPASTPPDPGKTETAPPPPPPAPEPPEQVRPGLIRDELDKKLARWVEEYQYPKDELDALTMDTFIAAKDSGKPYFPEMENWQFLWMNEGQRVTFSTDPTPQSECPIKEGKFIEEQAFDTFDNDYVGVINYIKDTPGAGPFKTDGKVRECFEHSSRGVILAALTYILQYPNWTEFISPEYQNKVIYSGTRRALNKMNFTQAVHRQIQDSTSYTIVTPSFYRVNKYDETGMEIDVIVYWSNEHYHETMTQSSLTMVWEKGDWRVGHHTDHEETAEHGGDGFIFLSGYAGSSDEGLPQGGGVAVE